MDASFMASNRRSKSGCCEVIQLAGELDFGTAPHLEAVLDRMMVIPEHMIVDVSRLTFVDSTGIRLLLRASKLVEGRIWIKGASRQTARVFDVTGVTDLFCFEDDPVLAHRTISQRRPEISSTTENVVVPPLQSDLTNAAAN